MTTPKRRATDKILGIDRQQLLGFIATVLSAAAGVAWTIQLSIARLETASQESAMRRELVMEGLHRELDTLTDRIAALEARGCNGR